MVKLLAVELHPAIEAVTDILPVISDPVVLAAEVKLKLPLPDAPRPISVLLLVHA